VELSPYQVKAMERLLANERYGLFDEMGLGKTAVAVEATVRSAQFPCLVTAPAYLLGNWRREILAWQPNAQVAVADGERPRRQAVYESNADFILSTYNAWHSYPVLTKRKWGRYVFDEAHRMRGRNSQWTKAVFKTQNVESKNRNTPFWDLTGTPLVRDGGDLWPFLHRIDRQMFRSYWSFVERHCHVEVTPWDRVIGRLINPRGFAELMSRYSIRRMASTIPELADLEHITTTIKVDMPPSVLKAMREARKTYVLDHPDMASPLDFDSGGALVTKLRQMATLPPTTSKPKIEAMLGKLEDSGNERCVVWCWFRDSAEYAAEAIRKQRKHVYVVHGGTAPSKVDEAPKEGEIVLAGMISAVDRRVNKKGEPWAIVTIEDLDASMEVLFFPKSYSVMYEDLVADSAVAVKGRVNWRDERMSVFASGVVSLDIADAQAGLVQPLVLKADALKLDHATVGELKSALIAHAGDTPLTLVLCYRNRETPLSIDGFSVSVTSALLGELKGIPGIAVAG